MMVRVYSVGCYYIYIIRVFSRPPFEEVVYGTTLRFWNCLPRYGLVKKLDKHETNSVMPFTSCNLYIIKLL